MKTVSKGLRHGFGRIEMIVVIAVVVALAVLMIPFLRRANLTSGFICCNCNLKEIGTACRLFAGDNGDLYPAQQTLISNGWKDFLTNGDAGQKCWMNFESLATDLGQSPKIVVCPSDERRAADNFAVHFGNTNVSYFVGVGANDTYPQSILGGDRNLGPGSTPDRDYGYSPKDGHGNDVIVPTNGAVCWSLKMHSAGNAAGAGNILLGDGSAQQVSSANFRLNWLPNGAGSNNFTVGHVPAATSIRLVFP